MLTQTSAASVAARRNAALPSRCAGTLRSGVSRLRAQAVRSENARLGASADSVIYCSYRSTTSGGRAVAASGVRPVSRSARRWRSRSQHWSSETLTASSRRRSSSMTLLRACSSRDSCSSATSCSISRVLPSAAGELLLRPRNPSLRAQNGAVPVNSAASASPARRQYRAARDALLARRSSCAGIPSGGAQRAGCRSAARSRPTTRLRSRRHVRLSELFEDGKDTLFLYSFMFIPGEAGLPLEEGCPSCTSIIDAMDGEVPAHRTADQFRGRRARVPLERVPCARAHRAAGATSACSPRRRAPITSTTRAESGR